MKYTIYTVPTPLMRCHGRSVYNPQIEERIHIQQHLANQHGDKPIYTKPLYVDVAYNMPMLQKHYKALNHKPHVSKPLLPDLEYALFSLCEGIIFKDMRQIISVKSLKLYGKVPSIIIEVREYEGEEIKKE